MDGDAVAINKNGLADLPEALLRLIVRKDSGPSVEDDRSATRSDASRNDAVRRYAMAVLDNAAKSVEGALGGTRNDALNKAAFNAGRWVGAGVLSEAMARATLESAASAAGLDKDREGRGVAGVRATISSGLRAGMERPADLSKIGQRGVKPKSGSKPTLLRATAKSAKMPDAAVDVGYLGGAPVDPDDDMPEALLEECALLEESDTDNGLRLIKYFGRDQLVRAETEVAGGNFLVWTGTHWDIEGGAAKVSLLAQRVGLLIEREADVMRPSDKGQGALDAAELAKAENGDA
jgi:putative DNA primase/helicase